MTLKTHLIIELFLEINLGNHRGGDQGKRSKGGELHGETANRIWIEECSRSNPMQRSYSCIKVSSHSSGIGDTYGNNKQRHPVCIYVVCKHRVMHRRHGCFSKVDDGWCAATRCEYRGTRYQVPPVDGKGILAP